MEFRVLGPLEVVNELGVVALGGPQQRRVLAALLSDPGHVLTYARLGEVLWPDGDGPANPRRSAITYVSRLRSAVGEGVVQTTDAGYVLDAASLNVDAARFVALVEHAATLPGARALDVLDQALALWRGPVFGDLSSEWWARPYVKKLDELRLTALANRIDAMTVDGWNGRAIAEVTSLLDAHPLRERFVEQAMRGLHASGQTAEALRAFHRYRTELADQTGLDPSPALVALESSMATGSTIDPSANEVSRQLRGYVLREMIGEGSFGAVYRATQPGVDRDVAVKVIRPELADDRSFVRRFEAEARLVARLEHPHIVPLYDFWRQPGGAFLVFRLLRGGSAEDLVRRSGPLSVERAGALLEQIGSALAAAHAAGIVHRDVKPANILFDDAGLAYLADFGIAAAVGGDAAMQPPSVPQRWSAGSALYASPEQLRDGVEDARADQYALAVTVWELLAGRPPFAGGDASTVIRSKLHEPLGPLDAVRPDVPAALAAVLERAGSVHPLDRYANVSELVGAWQRAMTGLVAGTTAPTSVAGANVDAATRSVAATLAGAGPRTVANPYKGLRPFGEADVEEFHGRGALVERLVAVVAATTSTTVVGPSGSGKSSLVLAGLVPRLRANRSLVVVMTPGESPYASLATALAQIANEHQTELLTGAALRRPDGVRAAVRAIGDEDELVVVIDQLEELWTLTGDDERQRFIAGLVDALGAGFVKLVATIRADFFDRPLADPLLGPLVSVGTFGVTPMSTIELHEAIAAPAEHLGVRLEPALVSKLVAESVDQPGSLPMLQFALAELFEGRDGAVITADAYEQLGGLAGALSRQADEIYHGFDAADRAAVRRLFSRLVTPGEGSEDTRRRVLVSDLAGVPARIVRAYVDRRLLTGDRDRTTREPTVEVAHEVLLRSWPRLQGWLAEDRAWLRELRGLSTATASWIGGGCDEADLLRGARLAVVAELATGHPDALTESEQRFLDRSLEQADTQAREAERRFQREARQNRRLRRSLVAIAAVLVVALAAGAIAVVQRQRADRQQRTAEAQRRIAVDQQAAAETQRQAADQQRTIADRQRTIADQQRVVAVDAQGQAQQSATAAQAAERASKLRALAGDSLSARSSERDLAALLALEAWKMAPDEASKSALFGTFTYDPGFMGYTRFEGAGGVGGLAIPNSTNMLLSVFPRTSNVVAPPSIVDVVTGATVRQLDPVDGQPVIDERFAVSPSGRLAAVRSQAKAGGPSVAAVFDLSTGKAVGAKIPLPDLRDGMALDASGTRLAVSADTVRDDTGAHTAYSGRVQVYDTTTGSVVATLLGVPGAEPVEADDLFSSTGAPAYGPDGRLWVGSTSGHLRAFDPSTFAQVADIAVPDGSTDDLLRFGDDGTTLVARSVRFVTETNSTTNQIGSLLRVDLATGTVTWQVTGRDYGFGECASFALSTRTDQLWCGDYFGRIRERSLASGARTGKVLQNQKGWATELDLVAVPGGTELVATSNNDGVLGRWHVDGGGPIQRLVAAGKITIGLFPDGVTALVGTPTGDGPPQDPTLWDLRTDTALPGLPAMLLPQVVGGSVFGVFADDQKVGRWDVTTRQRTEFAVGVPPVPTGTGGSIDARTVLLGYHDGHVDGYDSTTGAAVLHVRLPLEADGYQPEATGVSVSMDRRRVYVVGDGLVAFDGTTGEVLARNPDRAIGHVQVTASGLVIATSVDGTIALYDPVTLAKTSTLPGARGYIQDLAFSSDETTLVGRGNDGSVSLYDLAHGTRIGDPIEKPSGFRTPVSLRPDGAVLAVETGDVADTGIALWDLDPAHWVDAACAVAGRNLTREEWSTYIGDLAPYAATCPAFPVSP